MEKVIFLSGKTVLEDFVWKTSFKTWKTFSYPENFVRTFGKTLFLVSSLGGLCNTLKFERVLFDYNDQCHGW